MLWSQMKRLSYNDKIKTIQPVCNYGQLCLVGISCCEICQPMCACSIKVADDDYNVTQYNICMLYFTLLQHQFTICE